MNQSSGNLLSTVLETVLQQMHTVVIDLHIYLYTYIFHVGIIVVAPVEKRRNRACCNLANMPVSEEISPTTTHSQVTSPARLHIDSVKLSQTHVGIPLQKLFDMCGNEASYQGQAQRCHQHPDFPFFTMAKSKVRIHIGLKGQLAFQLMIFLSLRKLPLSTNASTSFSCVPVISLLCM